MMHGQKNIKKFSILFYTYICLPCKRNNRHISNGISLLILRNFSFLMLKQLERFISKLPPQTAAPSTNSFYLKLYFYQIYTSTFFEF